MQAQRLGGQVGEPDLSVDEADYFGVDPDLTENAEIFGLRSDPGQNQQLYRVSYLYLLVFGSDDDDKALDSEYGGMQLRAETFLWATNGAIPTRIQRIIQRTAHKAAYIFDSDIETSGYGANPYADGYLSGFDPWENGEDYDNWEVEPIAADEAHNPPGVIDWSSELYLDVDGLKYANLSGVAAGIANPWDSFTREQEGIDPVHIPPTKWQIGWEQARRRGEGEYYVRPQPDSQASKRYGETKEYGEGAGHGKTVYINGKPIANGTDGKSRAWLSPEYGVGDGLTYRGNWSREGLLQDDSQEATYAALRKGGVLYQTGETTEGIYLTTIRERPDGWEAADPDSVPVTLEVREGQTGRTLHFLRVDDPDDPLLVEAREDREVIKHLGKSYPEYRHAITEMFRFPDFRPVEQYGLIYERGEERDADQTSLDDWGEQV